MPSRSPVCRVIPGEAPPRVYRSPPQAAASIRRLGEVLDRIFESWGTDALARVSCLRTPDAITPDARREESPGQETRRASLRLEEFHASKTRVGSCRPPRFPESYSMNWAYQHLYAAPPPPGQLLCSMIS